MCRRANCLLSTFSATNPAVKTLLFRRDLLPVYLSMAVHCGVWHHLVCFLWKLPSRIIIIDLRENLEASLYISIILISFTVLAVSKVCIIILL